MADECDITAEREDRLAPMLIAASRKPEGPKATGHCLYCNAELAEGRWCDHDCETDWSWLRKAGKI